MSGLVEADFADVLRGLERLEHAANVRVGQALQLSADLVAKRAKDNHEYRDRTGNLTRSIRAGQVTGTLATRFKVDLLAGARGTEYASHVEYGTVPHIIRPVRRRFLRFVAGGVTVFARQVRHPGTRAYRFMQNALDATLPRAEELVGQAFDLAIAESGL